LLRWRWKRRRGSQLRDVAVEGVELLLLLLLLLLLFACSLSSYSILSSSSFRPEEGAVCSLLEAGEEKDVNLLSIGGRGGETDWG